MTVYERTLTNDIIKIMMKDGLTRKEAFKVLVKEYRMYFRCYESIDRVEALKNIFEVYNCCY